MLQGKRSGVLVGVPAGIVNADSRPGDDFLGQGQIVLLEAFRPLMPDEAGDSERGTGQQRNRHDEEVNAYRAALSALTGSDSAHRATWQVILYHRPAGRERIRGEQQGHADRPRRAAEHHSSPGNAVQNGPVGHSPGGEPCRALARMLAHHHAALNPEYRS